MNIRLCSEQNLNFNASDKIVSAIFSKFATLLEKKQRLEKEFCDIVHNYHLNL